MKSNYKNIRKTLNLLSGRLKQIIFICAMGTCMILVGCSVDASLDSRPNNGDNSSERAVTTPREPEKLVKSFWPNVAGQDIEMQKFLNDHEKDYYVDREILTQNAITLVLVRREVLE
jgi:hypothetical protein